MRCLHLPSMQEIVELCHAVRGGRQMKVIDPINVV